MTRFSLPVRIDPSGIVATATGELVATVRSGLHPLARLHPMPPPPADDGPAVVLVHGYLGHPGMFRPLTRRLYEAGRGNVVTVGYPSTRLGLEHIAKRIEEVVLPLAADGPVDLVGHSLGAVASRAWIKVFGGSRFVRRFVSLGGPHAGTLVYRFTPPILWPVLDPQGPWVRCLAEGPEPVPTVVIRARYDHQVLPPVCAAVPGAAEVVLSGCGHNGLLWSRRAHDEVVRALAAP